MLSSTSAIGVFCEFAVGFDSFCDTIGIFIPAEINVDSVYVVLRGADCLGYKCLPSADCREGLFVSDSSFSARIVLL